MSDITRRILSRNLKDTNSQEYVGREGDVFYDPDNLELRGSDGSTPGGVSLGVGTDVNINTTGIITASAFIGDGSGLTNLPGGGGGQWTTSGAGIYYSGGNVAIGGPVSAGSTVLMVHGDARITGILSVGTATITLDPNTNTVSIGTAIAISAEKESLTLGATDDIRRSDMGLSGIATATGRLPGTLSFSGEAFSGQRVTTTAESGTVTSIPHQLAGPVGVASTYPTFGGYDDGAWEIVLPFDIEYIGITTNIFYVTTNSYITFTGSATNYYLIDPQYGIPELPKIMISAGDSYSKGIYFWEDGVAPNRTYYVRYEGLTLLENNERAFPNTDQVIWEAVFYENAPSQIDIQIGDNPRYTSLNSPNVKLSIDGVIGFVDSNIRIGDKTTGCFLTNYNNYYYGVNNIFLGKGAGKNTSGGTSNNFFGLNSGYNNVNGRYNNFLGRFTGYCNCSGSFNNFLGDNAGYNNVDGSHNNFLGRSVGFFNTYGYNNNFLGDNAGYNNVGGSHNNFLGRSAGFFNTYGYNNNFFGPYAGCFNTTGSYNNFFGRNAGRYNTTGCLNNFLGPYAGLNNTTGCNNNFFGRAAGYCNTDGVDNIFLGSYAGRCNTSGSRNQFIGRCAGCSNTTGEGNIFMGTYSAFYNTTGNYNIYFGANTGYSTSASSKVIIGSGTGYGIFDSPDTDKDMQLAVGVKTDYNSSKYWLVGDENFNVGIGTTNPQYKLDVGGDINLTGTLYQNGTPFSGGGGGSGAFSYCCTNNITSTDLTSHPDITTACHNFFAGVGAGCSITEGRYNNFFGYCAGRNNTTGCGNNFFGQYAGLKNTGGYGNFFGGYSAGCSNTTGRYNIFIGERAGRLNTVGNNNIFLGNETGYSNNGYGNNFFGRAAGNRSSSGEYNNFFGVCSGFYNTIGCFNNFFGSFTGISTSASNKVIIGSSAIYYQLFDSPDTTKDTQFAVGVKTDTNPSKYWLVGNENFDVGIGTTNPQYKLDVGGDLNFTGTLYQDGVEFSGGGGGGIGRIAISQTTGSLGIGSTANITFTDGMQQYALLKVAVTDGAWVTIYTDEASRASDASRSIDTDPTPGSGVIAEMISTGTGITTQRFTPGVIGYNDDEPVSNNIYAKVYNNSGITTDITVTLTISD